MRFFLLSVVAAALIGALAVRPLVRRSRGWKMRRDARELATAAGIGYGVLGRVVFGASYAEWPTHVPDDLKSGFAVMSGSFLFLIPLVIGVLDQAAVDKGRGTHGNAWVRAFFEPMLPVLLMLGLVALLTIEGSICIAMAAPIFFLLSGVGGLVGVAVRKHTEGKTRASALSLMLLLPYLASPLEQHLPVPVERRAVENTVLIHAPPSVVWEEIKSVRVIEPCELPWRVAHVIGLPRPVEATLSHDGVGGVRVATFERGLRFREIVTTWDPGHRLSFDIRAEPAPAAALDEHVAVGGPYFDVIDGTYEIEGLADGATLLKLTSHQRLSTRFNFYAARWTDFIMSDLQSAIMEVIRVRSEHRGA